MKDTKENKPEESPEKETSSNEQTEALIPLPQDILDKIPKELKPHLAKAFSSMSLEMTRGIFPVTNPLIDKINPQHIDKLIDSIEKDSERDENRHKGDRRYIFASFVILLIILSGLITTFVVLEETELVRSLVIAIVSLIGGFGSGYGYCKSREGK
jgi:hypothetical protein